MKYYPLFFISTNIKLYINFFFSKLMRHFINNLIQLHYKNNNYIIINLNKNAHHPLTILKMISMTYYAYIKFIQIRYCISILAT